MIRRPPRSTRTDTLFPYTTLFRSLSLPRASTNGNGLQAPSRHRPLCFAAVAHEQHMPRSLPARVSPKRTHGFPIRNDAPPTGIRHRRPKRHAERDRSAWRCTKRSEEHTSELQSLMRISYAVFCLKKKKNNYNQRISKTTEKH